MSRVTIVMATYNGENYVREQIESILASSHQDFDLFIYDDGSSDLTLSIIKNYEKEYTNKIHVFQNEKNLGVTTNFLQAICKTTTDYVMMCDQDDVWKTNKIAITLRRMKHLEAQKGKELPLAVFSDAIVVDRDLNVIQDSFFKAGCLDPRKTDLHHLLMENKLIGCTVMINAAHRKVLQGRQLPKEARFHDWWIALIAATFGGIGFVNEGTLLYRQHGGNVVGNTGFLSYVSNRLMSLRKQKEALLLLQNQAREFLLLYEDIIDNDKKVVIGCFAHLNDNNYVMRRVDILRNGFVKTGFIRNIGLMIIV